MARKNIHLQLLPEERAVLLKWIFTPGGPLATRSVRCERSRYDDHRHADGCELAGQRSQSRDCQEGMPRARSPSTSPSGWSSSSRPTTDGWKAGTGNGCTGYPAASPPGRLPAACPTPGPRDDQEPPAKRPLRRGCNAHSSASYSSGFSVRLGSCHRGWGSMRCPIARADHAELCGEHCGGKVWAARVTGTDRWKLGQHWGIIRWRVVGLQSGPGGVREVRFRVVSGETPGSRQIYEDWNGERQGSCRRVS